MEETAWYAADDPVAAIRNGSASAPKAWPEQAVEDGVMADTTAYVAALQTAAIAACEAEIDAWSAADDQQVKQRIRAIDDIERIANELAERVHEWAIASGLDVDASPTAVAAFADEDDATGEPMHPLARSVADLMAQRDTLETDVERLMTDLAPNLTALAGPLLGARLIALAGDLESLAKSPSGTVQVLGAEDALFAHLNEGAPPPKHGIIYTHDAVRGTDPAHRGSASRALAGKLAIAARIDHYAGDRRPELEQDLHDRIATIRERSS